MGRQHNLRHAKRFEVFVTDRQLAMIDKVRAEINQSRGAFVRTALETHVTFLLGESWEEPEEVDINPLGLKTETPKI